MAYMINILIVFFCRQFGRRTEEH